MGPRWSGGGVVEPGNGRGSVGHRVDSRESAKIAGRLRDVRCVYWKADSTLIGDTKGRGRVGAVGDRYGSKYCPNRQLIIGLGLTIRSCSACSIWGLSGPLCHLVRSLQTERYSTKDTLYQILTPEGKLYPSL